MHSFEASVAEVFLRDGRRPINEANVTRLMESIKAIGLKTPIAVIGDDNIPDPESGELIEGYYVVAGAHRLEACRRLGFTDIDAIEFKDATDAEIWEIDENLCRAELTAVEQSEHLARRKALWETRQSGQNVPIDSKRDDGKGHRPDGFAGETAKATGKTKRDINRSIARAGVSQAARDLIRGTPLDRGTYLDKLLKMDLSDDDEVAQVKRDLADIADKERRKRLKDEEEVRRKEAAEARKQAKMDVCDLLLDALSPREWDRTIALLDICGSVSASDLRNWQQPGS